MLDLVVLDGMVQLAFGLILKCGLLLRILDHNQALAYPIELVLEHDHALKIDLFGHQQIQQSAN